MILARSRVLCSCDNCAARTRAGILPDFVIMAAADEAEARWQALVVANQGEHFSAGANLMLMLLAAQEEEVTRGVSDRLNVVVREIADKEGITPELFQQIAPRASGKFILLVQVHGRLPVRETQGSGRGLFTGGVRGGRHGTGYGAQGASRADDNALDMSVTLVSTETHDAVGRIAMRYTGTSVEDALAKFTARVQSTLPGATCAGWTWPDATVKAAP